MWGGEERREDKIHDFCFFCCILAYSLPISKGEPQATLLYHQGQFEVIGEHEPFCYTTKGTRFHLSTGIILHDLHFTQEHLRILNKKSSNLSLKTLKDDKDDSLCPLLAQ